AAEALREAMARLELATSGAGVGVFSRNLISNAAHWDEHTFRLFGLAPSATPPDWPELLTALHPDDRERYGRILNSVVATGEFPDTELRVVDPGGAVRQLLVRGRAERNDAGKVTQFAGVVRDITARKQAEERAAEYAEWLRLATQSVGIGFAQRDLTTGIGTWTAEAKRMLGLPPDAPAPSPAEFLARIAPDERARAAELMSQPPPAGRTSEVGEDLEGLDD